MGSSTVHRDLEARLQALEQTNRRIRKDAAAHRKAERVLRHEEERYRSYVDNAPYGVLVGDGEGNNVEVNAAAARLTGYTREELAELSFYDIVAPESMDWARGQAAHLLKHGKATGTATFVRKDGSTFPGRMDAVMLSPERSLGFLIDISQQKLAEDEIVAAAARLKLMLKAAVSALGTTIELRDPYTAGHQRRVSELAGAIAADLGWDPESIEDLMTASLLHDIGKIVVPAEVLTRPGKLNAVEMDLIRRHSTAGADTVAEIDAQGTLADIVRQHHERLDGSGYPLGLGGTQILPAARVLAVADVVEAMVSHRPYRPALPAAMAMAEIRDGLGARYDGAAAAACLRLLEEEGFVFSTVGALR